MKTNNLEEARTTEIVRARLETVSPFAKIVWSALVINTMEKWPELVSCRDLAKTLEAGMIQVVGAVHVLTKAKLAYTKKIKPEKGKEYTGIGVYLRDEAGSPWSEYLAEIRTAGIPAVPASKKWAKKKAKKTEKKASKPAKKTTKKTEAAIADPTDSVQGSTLTQALQLLNKVADAKSQMAILANVRIETHGDKLTMRTTDLNTHLEVTLPYKKKHFMTSVNAKALGKMIATKGTKQGERVKLGLASEKLEIDAHGINVKLETRPAEDFPKFPDGTWEPVAEWSSEAFKSALEYVLPAISEDETRPHINSLCLQDGKAIATDGHRMHWAPTPTKTDKPLLIPRAAAKVLYSFIGLSDTVTISTGPGGLLFTAGNFRMACRMSDSEFPPYKEVIPKKQSGSLTLETETFSNVVKKLSSLKSGRSDGIVIDYNENFEISIDNPEHGQASAEMEAKSKYDEIHTPKLRIGISARILLDAVAKSEKFTLQYEGALDPMVIRDGDRGAVVMPMRI